jgi:GH25 family lysozyme M1 (1,4-beta-N-acetylmuramidase)
MTLYVHVPHPHLKHRAERGAPTVGQAVAEHPSFNMRLAAWGTQRFGTMGAFYAFVIYGALGAVFTAYQVTLLYWSNWVQLWSLPLLAVGSAVLGIALNKMMKRQFDDVELLVHQNGETANHLAAQDEKILAILAQIEQNTALTEEVRAALQPGHAETAPAEVHGNPEGEAMTGSAQGIDISAYQPVYAPAELARYSFGFFKATEGASGTDLNFSANWANGKTAGIHRGAYCELTATAPAAAQAGHFISVLKAARVEPGDMMAVVASDHPVTGAAVLTWLEAVKAAFPQSPVLVYSDLSALPGLGACTAYPLWVAAYRDTAPKSVAPWETWRFWQYQGTTAPDNDAYNGTAAELQAWLDTFVPAG